MKSKISASRGSRGWLLAIGYIIGQLGLPPHLEEALRSLLQAFAGV